MLKLKISLLLSAFIFLLPGANFAATAVNLRLKSLSFIQQNMQYQEVSRHLDFKHTLHLRLQETYHNYPVWGAQAIVHIPHAGQDSLKKSVVSLLASAAQAPLNGIFYQNLSQDLQAAPAAIFQPAQTEKALQQALAVYQAKQGVAQEISDKQSHLWVYIDKNQKAHWVYFVQFLADSPQKSAAKPSYLMDARTFQVYRYWDNIQTQALHCAGMERGFCEPLGGGLGGNLKMGKLIYDGLEEHLPPLNIQRDPDTQLCYLKNSEVIVRDVRYRNAIEQYVCAERDLEHNNLFWNGDQDAANGGYSPGNDALFAGMVVKSMYQEWYGIPVLTEAGKPMPLVMLVHKDIDNAYWDGRQMIFGDGVSLFYPLTSLGVSAHEISHGFTQQQSNLMYFDQSGGLNEAFSDMAAQAAEFYVNGQSSWQIGAEIVKAEGRVLRYMEHPAMDCAWRRTRDNPDCSIEHINDYHEDLDVHFSSGIFNRVFYLISTAPGWDTHKAFNIMVQANINYWTPFTSFDEAAYGVIMAAQDYGYPLDTVLTAFSAVGIDINSI